MTINKKPLRDLKKAVREMQDVLHPTLAQVFDANKSVIKNYNTQLQLYDKGINAMNISLRPAYAASTKRYKVKRRQPTDRVTLKDTGDFYSSIEIIAEADRLIIETDIEYGRFLVSRYGKDILGITNMNLTDFYNKYIKEELKLSLEDIITKYSYD